MSIKTIGEKIKTLRKELKLTQSELVGEQLSKGMLSLIENNLSNPSVKTLHYIANKLGKPISYFINEIPTEIKEITERNLNTEILLEKISKFDELENLNEYAQALEILRNLTSEYIKDDDSILSANLLYKFGKFFIKFSKMDESEDYLLQASKIYSSNEMYINAAEAYLATYTKHFNHFDTVKCNEIIENTESLYRKSVNKDPLFEIRFLHKKITHLGNNNRDLNIINETIDEALSLSKKNDLYYYEELYRCKAVLATEYGMYDEFKESIEKSLKFCELTDSANLRIVLTTIATGENTFGNPIAALEAIDKTKRLKITSLEFGDPTSFELVMKAEEAKAHYSLGNYLESEKIFESIDFDNLENKILFNPQRIFLYEKKIYYCLLLSKLKKFDLAINFIENIIQKPVVEGQNHFLNFAYRCLSEIYSEKGDYQSAFSYQKKAAEYIENLTRSKNIPKSYELEKGQPND